MGKTKQQPTEHDPGPRNKLYDEERRAKTRREKTRLKVQAWQKKQRQNKEKHEELKKLDRNRKKVTRLLQQQEAKLDTDIQKQLKEKKREEMRKYRQKKKTKSPADHRPEDKRTMMMEQNKKKAVKRTQEWRLRVQLKTHTQQESNVQTADGPTKKVAQLESSRATMYRHLKKIKQILPNAPKRRAAVIGKLIESLSTSKVLAEKKVIVSPECKRKLEITNEVIQSVTDSVTEVKTRQKGTKKDAYNIICDSVLKKYRRHTLNKYFKLSVKARKNRSKWWEKVQRQRRKDALTHEITNSVKNFFLSPEISKNVFDV